MPSTSPERKLLDRHHSGEDGHPKINPVRRTPSQRTLRLFESPLAHDRLERGAPIESRPRSLKISSPNETATAHRNPDTPWAGKNNRFFDRDEKEEVDFDSDDEDVKKRLSAYEATPEFKRYEDATNIELFYDLFFVANLTTFTEVHEINDESALKSYAGFFCILWFLYLQVSLFDVRFGQDSILERIGKAAQFGVMVALACIAPEFNPDKQQKDVFQSLAVVLSVSRFILACQYGVVAYLVWNHKKTKMPMILMMLANFLAALCYAATIFGFQNNNPHSKVFIVWYFTAAIETAFNVAGSIKWKVLSFEGTHLKKRMSLLTLIILGEGVIALMKILATIASNEPDWNAPLIFTIASAMGILYFIYMIYFDGCVPDSATASHGGYATPTTEGLLKKLSYWARIREGLWTFMHFPFHLALVILVEGTSQFVLWRKVTQTIRRVANLYVVAYATLTEPPNDSRALALALATTTEKVFVEFPPRFTRSVEESIKALQTIRRAVYNSTEQLESFSTLLAVVESSVFDAFGVEPPRTAALSLNPEEETNKQLEVFMLVFTYFFITAGMTLILMNTLRILANVPKTTMDYLRTAFIFLVGIGTTVVASMVNTPQGFEYAQSALILPSVAGLYLMVLAMGYWQLSK